HVDETVLRRVVVLGVSSKSFFFGEYTAQSLEPGGVVLSQPSDPDSGGVAIEDLAVTTGNQVRVFDLGDRQRGVVQSLGPRLQGPDHLCTPEAVHSFDHRFRISNPDEAGARRRISARNAICAEISPARIPSSYSNVGCALSSGWPSGFITSSGLRNGSASRASRSTLARCC